jgi:hypothetical protein
MAAKKKAKGKKPAATARAARKPGRASRRPATRVSAKKAKANEAAAARKTSSKRLLVKKKTTATKMPRVQTMNHPVFGRVKVDPGAGAYWQKTLRVADRDVAVDMTIEDPAEATPELLDRAAQLVARLSHFDALARAGLRHSYDEDPDSAVALYVTHHLQELSAQTLIGIFDKPKESIVVDDFLARLFLKGVGSYPARSGGSATFDYTISADRTQYVLAVQLDESGEVLGIEMES